MRFARRFSVSTRWQAGVLPLCAAGPRLPRRGRGRRATSSRRRSATGSDRAGGRDAADPAAHEHAAPEHGSPGLAEEAQAVADSAIFTVTSESRPVPAGEASRSRASRTPPPLSLLRPPGPARRQLRAGPLRDGDRCATPGTDACAVDYLNRPPQKRTAGRSPRARWIASPARAAFTTRCEASS